MSHPFNNSTGNQSSALTTDSGVPSDESTSPTDTSRRKIITDTFIEKIVASVLFQRCIQRLTKENIPIMKVRRLSSLNDTIKQLLMSDDEVKDRWHKLCYVYWHDRHCHDDERIENEIFQCFYALINDGKGTMIGLDSESSLKDLLITSMRICSEPEFKLEIRIGFGGTKDSVNLRAPSYAIAGIQVLEQLLILREKFPANQPQLGENIPTRMLINPPILTFFFAWTPAVKINGLNEAIVKKNAHDLLKYIKMYIELSYPPNLTNYVQYELDHENTFDEQLLTRIIEHYNSIHDDNIEKVKRELVDIAIKRGSNKEGSIRYSSMHLIMAKDIIDKNVPLYVVNENENNLQGNQVCLYDCIITIGGSIEEKFNIVRHPVRKTFIQESQENNENNFHFPLSIRLISKAGQFPVYYHLPPHDITGNDVRTRQVTTSRITNNESNAIKEDLSILKEDVGRNLLKPLWNRISNTELNKTSSWRNIVLNLANLCLDVSENHAQNNNRTCQCSVQNQTAFQQVCAHYNLSDVLDNDTRSILQNILDVLEREIKRFLDEPPKHEIKFSFGQPFKDLHRTWKRQISNSEIFTVLDNLLVPILLGFARRILP